MGVILEMHILYIIKSMAAKKLINVIYKKGQLLVNKQIAENLIKQQATPSTIVQIHPGYNHLNINKLSLTKNLHWKDKLFKNF